MADPMTGPITKCPWCSAELSPPGAERCAACGAALTSQAGGVEPDIRGVTTLDPEAIIRARAEVSRPRGGFFSFLTGEPPPETGGPASPESLAPPSNDVRREMLRLQIEAERADLVAETIALKSDVLAKHGIHVSQLAGDVSVDAQAGLVVAAATEAGEGPGAAENDETRADGPGEPAASSEPQAAAEPAAATEPRAGADGAPQA